MAALSKTYTAKDLLDATLEFVSLVPDSSSWKESSLKENPPLLLRFRQIQSLIKAFFSRKAPSNFMQKAKALFSAEHTIDIQSLLSGAFIRYRDPEVYSSAVDFIKTAVKEKEGAVDMEAPISMDKLTLAYQYLMNYKRNLSALLLFNTDPLKEGSITSRFIDYITSSITKNIQGKYGQLDEALDLLISPHRDSFTEEQLQAEYNYPREDLHEVEADFRVKHPAH
jgi:hypothetical protein